MVLPYQRLSPLGKSSMLCGSRGTGIYTVDIESRTLLSSWSHPLSRKSEPKVDVDEAGKSGEQESDQPPSKKRKLESNGEDKVEGQETEAPAENAESTANGKGKGKKQKPKQSTAPRPQEQPFVILMTATSDGNHVVAVTGQDKTVWVLEHDGKGGLKELSQRAMPKRPSSIILTADGKTILCADKFGDVYFLPLIPSGSTTSEASNASTPVSTPVPPQTNKPKGANKFTVHSKRNLRALEDQEKQWNANKDTPKEGPNFEHKLIIGHVSMLTAVTIASSKGKPYILTADRDEHIRVSRGIPQAYVVENYCLGHKAFIGALCTPVLQPELLISGGGDNELFVWDWLAGELLHKVDLLSHVRGVVADTQKIAVSGLYSHPTERGSNVIAICERVRAIFIFELQRDTLVHVQTIQLIGNPLDIAVLNAEGQPLRLAVAVDPVLGGIDDEVDSSLLLLDVDGSGKVSVAKTPLPIADTADVDISRDELDKILYTVENLRKTEFEDADGDDQSTKGSVIGQGEGATDSMEVGEAT